MKPALVIVVTILVVAAAYYVFVHKETSWIEPTEQFQFGCHEGTGMITADCDGMQHLCEDDCHEKYDKRPNDRSECLRRCQADAGTCGEVLARLQATISWAHEWFMFGGIFVHPDAAFIDDCLHTCGYVTADEERIQCIYPGKEVVAPSGYTILGTVTVQTESIRVTEMNGDQPRAGDFVVHVTGDHVGEALTRETLTRHTKHGTTSNLRIDPSRTETTEGSKYTTCTFKDLRDGGSSRERILDLHCVMSAGLPEDMCLWVEFSSQLWSMGCSPILYPQADNELGDRRGGNSFVDLRFPKKSVKIPATVDFQQVARILVNEGFGTEDELVTILRDCEWLRSLGASVPATEKALTCGEGYLSPGVWTIEIRTPLRRIVAAMVKRTLKDLEDIKRENVEVYSELQQEFGLEDWELLTLASLVDAAANQERDQRLITSMYYNRLRKGMPLQCEPSLTYTMDRMGTAPRRVDRLDDQNSYNTYVYSGLPPGPINSPGRSAIEAVFAPFDSDYLYARPEGGDATGYRYFRTYTEYLDALLPKTPDPAPPKKKSPPRKRGWLHVEAPPDLASGLRIAPSSTSLLLSRSQARSMVERVFGGAVTLAEQPDFVDRYAFAVQDGHRSLPFDPAPVFVEVGLHALEGPFGTDAGPALVVPIAVEDPEASQWTSRDVGIITFAGRPDALGARLGAAALRAPQGWVVRTEAFDAQGDGTQELLLEIEYSGPQGTLMREASAWSLATARARLLWHGITLDDAPGRGAARARAWDVHPIPGQARGNDLQITEHLRTYHVDSTLERTLVKDVVVSRSKARLSDGQAPTP